MCCIISTGNSSKNLDLTFRSASGFYCHGSLLLASRTLILGLIDELGVLNTFPCVAVCDIENLNGLGSIENL